MPRLILAECKQEVSTFNPIASYYSDFRVVRGQAMLDYHRKVGEEIGGALSVFEPNSNLELVPTVGMSANTSGGVLTAESFGTISATG